jgi:hypothetical protein
MRAALISATSLAALLAFEVGLDVAIDVQPARAQTFSVSNSTLGFGYVLLNTSGGTSSVVTETVTNSYSHHNSITFGAAASPFSGASSVTTLSNTIGSSVTAKNTYTFSPTVTGTFSSHVTIAGNGYGGGTTVTVPMTGTAVAPVQSATASAFGAVRIGTTATIAAITVSNIGDGNLASKTGNGNLQGSLGAPSGSVFKGSGGSFTLNDSNYGSGATTSAAFTYTYAPTAHTTSDSATVVASFTNGNSAGTNAAQTTSLTLAGSGVGPAYASNIGGAIYSNSTNVGNNTIAAGTISVAAGKPGATSTMMITLSNVSNDIGSASLTDLTLEHFSLTGANAADFSVVGFTTNTVLAEAQSVTVMLDFSGPTAGNYTANLSFSTDEGAPAGGAGAVMAYLLDPDVIPEPATVLTFGMGLAGLGWARRRRAKRATGTDALAG